MRAIAAGLCALWLFGAAPRVARADDPGQQARALNEKALAEFGLGDFAQAAEHYEMAFRLKPDDALLYNAAQAHRLAGNKKRALDLYRNFVRVYGGRSPMTADAKRHVAELEPAVADAGAPASPAASATAPPAVAVVPAPVPAQPPKTLPPPPAVAMAPAIATPAPGSASTLPAATNAAAPEPVALALQSPPPDRPHERSPLANPWIWCGVGAAVAAGVVAFLLATHPSYPDADLGHAMLGRP